MGQVERARKVPQQAIGAQLVSNDKENIAVRSFHVLIIPKIRFPA
jgi:hypothetical protein